MLVPPRRTVDEKGVQRKGEDRNLSLQPKVHFSLGQSVYFTVINREEYSRSEKEACWYSKSERRTMYADSLVSGDVDRNDDDGMTSSDLAYYYTSNAGAVSYLQQLGGNNDEYSDEEDEVVSRRPDCRWNSNGDGYGTDSDGAEESVESSFHALSQTRRIVEEEEIHGKEEIGLLLEAFPDGLSWYRPLRLEEREPRRHRSRRRRLKSAPPQEETDSDENIRQEVRLISPPVLRNRNGLDRRRRGRLLSARRKSILL